MTQIEPNRCCHECRENIPWLVNDTLSDSAAAEVREHIRDCLDCRADFELHEKMQAAVLAGTPMMTMTLLTSCSRTITLVCFRSCFD